MALGFAGLFESNVGDEGKRRDTHFYNVTAAAFIPKNPDIDNINYDPDEAFLRVTVGNVSVMANITLPEGATIISCVVFGNGTAATKTWRLSRNKLSASIDIDSIANANVNTKDATAINATIDNENFGYFIAIQELPTASNIFGAIIEYVNN